MGAEQGLRPGQGREPLEETRPVVVIDYGIGNLSSAVKALRRLAPGARAASDPAEVPNAPAAIVVPGVGSFGAVARRIRELGFDRVIRRCLDEGIPYLGICVGMQLLFSRSEESPSEKGLALLEGEVIRMNAPIVPHMQWSETTLSDSPLFRELPSSAWFYYVHSFQCVPDDPSVVAAYCDYFGTFAAAVCRPPIYGVQFHPEKSGAAGLRLLAGFLALTKE